MIDKDLITMIASEIGHDHSGLPRIVQLMHQRQQERVNSRQRRAVIGVAAAVAVLAAAISITATQSSVPPTTTAGGGTTPLPAVKVVPTEGRCYAKADPRITQHINVQMGTKAGKPAPTVADYLDICTTVWAHRELLPSPPYVNPAPSLETDSGAHVPTLVACAANKFGGLEVYPGQSSSDTCSRMGLLAATD